MVLQQAPAKACVFGMLGAGGTAATVSISSSSEFAAAADEQVAAEVDVSSGQWKACLAPQKVGGDYTITATCTGCASAKAAASIEHVTFGDVWYCSGQSNMALPLLHSYSRNETRDAVLAGKYANIRIQGLAGNMNSDQPWATLKQALAQRSCGGHGGCKTGTDSDSSSLMMFSASCFYFGQELSDTIGAANGDKAPPIGLVHTAWGGSTIEQWLTNKTIATCEYASPSPSNQEYHDTRVVPYLGMTLKGFVWYQGENNCHSVMGNSAAKSGYSCEMQALVDQWRGLWSVSPGTTNPLAPFGIVTLASSGSEGASSLAMGAMRQAQTAGFGVLPPPASNQVRGSSYILLGLITQSIPRTLWAFLRSMCVSLKAEDCELVLHFHFHSQHQGGMANTFLAQAYDLDDEWSGDRGPCLEISWNISSPKHVCCSASTNVSAFQHFVLGLFPETNVAQITKATTSTRRPASMVRFQWEESSFPIEESRFTGQES